MKQIMLNATSLNILYQPKNNIIVMCCNAFVILKIFVFIVCLVNRELWLNR